MNDKKSVTACFTGHRKISPNESSVVSEKLRKTLVQCIENGYCYFWAGGALGFDYVYKFIM